MFKAWRIRRAKRKLAVAEARLEAYREMIKISAVGGLNLDNYMGNVAYYKCKLAELTA